MTPEPVAEPDELVAARQRAGRAIRDLGHAFVGRHATVEQLDRLTEFLDGFNAELRPLTPRTRDQQPLRVSGANPVAYPHGPFTHDFDDRPISGRSSPWGLDLELHRHGDEIEAFVTLRSAHEGAPNRAHGGVVAALFDDVFGFVLGVIQAPAFTGDLSVRYQAPTPLFRRLACRVGLHDRQGRKILLEFAQALEELAKVEMLPKMEGKRMHIILSPKAMPKKK